MYTKQPQKLLIINILDILKRYTDENHRLSQKEIVDIQRCCRGKPNTQQHKPWPIL